MLAVTVNVIGMSARSYAIKNQKRQGDIAHSPKLTTNSMETIYDPGTL